MLYPIAIEAGDDNTAFGVVFPDAAGCFAAGDSYEDALVQAKEALEFYFETLAEDGEVPPLASSVNDHFDKEEFNGWVWALVDIDLESFLGKSRKYNVSLPTLLRKKIDDAVDEHKHYGGFSQFVQEAIVKELARSKGR
ncbi:type II toxin-antitoxin system HicB family antitoxin [Thaumasiovibrio subtropicus]|uniref:type II toxin-antitoxin system HicB family antitoxin n=1 Tax=Thaumasiovibrio subtropicus TaxID=1891207 RepID=UPI000B363358|nr:type II toxin-antitoxin system HicB family antitoxin [Thaumasiovibrio subtropicus]